MTEPAPSRRADATLIYDDYLRRRDAGEAIDFEALCRAHADAAAALRKREAARVLLETLLPGPLASEDGESAPAESASETDAGTTHELLARLRAIGPRGNRYRVLGEIARGGMGIVLRVVDTELRRKLAMKVARASGPSASPVTPDSEAKALDRFLQEAQITSQLDHPGIVPVYEIGIGADGHVFFTMRYVRGQTLKEVFELVRDGAKGWSQLRAVHVLLRVCETMSYAHDKNTIHRDLKPANIMVGRFGEVYVMDWGLGRVLGGPDGQDSGAGQPASAGESQVETLRDDERDATPDSPRLTVDGEVLGTPAYMAPEQAGGEHEQVGPRSDVYAVGAMLYHLISGEMPYVAAGERVSSRAVRLRVVAGPPRSLHEFGRKSPPALVAICDKAMARRIEDRYPDMRVLGNDLRAYAEGRVVAAYETGSWAETKIWVRRNKNAFAGMLAGVIAVTLVVIIVIVPEARERQRFEGVRHTIQSLIEFDRDAGDPDFGKQLAESTTAWWRRRADALLGSRTDLEDERTRLRRGLVPTEAHRAQAMASLGRTEELQTKLELLLWRRRMLSDAKWPDVADVKGDVDAQLNKIDSADGLRPINNLVFRMTRPDEPRTLGSEVFACALAERLVNWHDASLILPTYRDTYAFALFRVGQLDRAVQEQERAVNDQEQRVKQREGDDSIPADAMQLQRAVAQDLLSNLAILKSFRDDWRDVERQRRLTEDLAADVATLEREIEDNAFSLAMGTEAARHRDVASALRRLDQIAQKRSIARRAIVDAGAPQLWQRAIEAVEKAPAYGSRVRLTPQIDLLPLGEDPESHLWEFIHLPSGEPPRRGTDGKFEIAPETGIVFVLLPGGRVPVEEGKRGFHMHRIDLDAFFLSKYELTEQQYVRLGGGWSRRSVEDSPLVTRPQLGISWDSAASLLEHAGGWLCLPTSAQWELGCRAGTTTRWWTGDSNESLWGAVFLLDGPDSAGRPGTSRPNAFGLHDTLGGAAEWCCDGAADDAPARVGDGRRLTNSERRWVRGGSTATRIKSLRTGFRPMSLGDEDLDKDGDHDQEDEAPRHYGQAYFGLRPARPLLR